MSLSELLKPDMTLSNVALTAASYVFERERHSMMDTPEENLMQWQSNGSMPVPLRATHFSGKEMPHYAFFIDGEDADEFTVFLDNDNAEIPERTLGQDVFSDYFFKRYATLYDAHQHTVCIRGVRIALQYKKRKEALLADQARRNSMAEGLPLRIIDKRSSSAR